MAHGARTARVQHATGQHQRPGRGVHKAGCRFAKVRAPVRWCDLVFDQRVDGVRVGHTQQCLGQTHQGNALVGAETIFGQKTLHQAGIGGSADLADPSGGTCGDGRAVGLVQAGKGNKFRQHLVLVGIGRSIDVKAQGLFSVAGHDLSFWQMYHCIAGSEGDLTIMILLVGNLDRNSRVSHGI